MMKAIRPKLRGIFVPGRRYKKSGVLFYGLESGENAPGDLFAPRENGEDAGLFSVVDRINAKYGRGTLFTLGEGTQKTWQMKRTLLSPDYTTSWDQLLKVK
jgi:DNA polymerase V